MLSTSLTPAWTVSPTDWRPLGPSASPRHVHVSTTAAQRLLSMAEAGPLSALQRARADRVRAQLAFVTNRSSDAPPLLLKAARRLAAVGPDLSRSTYLESL